MGHAQSADDFSLVILSKINPEAPLPVDLYVYVDKKYLRFKSQGDFLTSEKYDQFIAKGVNHLYIRSDDIMAFLDWVQDQHAAEVNAMVTEAGEENREAIEQGLAIKEKVFETFVDQELDQAKVQVLVAQTGEFVEQVRKDPVVVKAIAALMKRNQSIADHSVNVANISIYLAMLMGHGGQLVLENVYLGGIFHDYGKAKIPPHLLENQTSRLYSQAIQDHPQNGVKVIQKFPGISEQVFAIILQHHEQYNGGGFPKGLKGEEVNELANLVAMANIFDNSLRENRHLPPLQRFRKGIKILDHQKGKFFFPKFYPRVIEGLEKALLEDPTPKKWVV